MNEPKQTGRVAEVELSGMCFAAAHDGSARLVTLGGAGPFVALFETREQCDAFYARIGIVVERPMAVVIPRVFIDSMPEGVRVIFNAREVEPNVWRWFEVSRLDVVH